MAKMTIEIPDLMWREVTSVMAKIVDWLNTAGQIMLAYDDTLTTEDLMLVSTTNPFSMLDTFVLMVHDVSVAQVRVTGTYRMELVWLCKPWELDSLVGGPDVL